jgi:hypothetical protein
VWNGSPGPRRQGEWTPTTPAPARGDAHLDAVREVPPWFSGERCSGFDVARPRVVRSISRIVRRVNPLAIHCLDR